MDIIFQAIEAYEVVCEKHITVYDRKGNAYPVLCYVAPSWNLCEVGRKYVHLRNCNGEIARYNIKTGEITI